MSKICDNAMAAISGLSKGDVAPLALYLVENGDGNIEPLVIRTLLRAIVGDVSQTDHRLAFVKHPDLKHQKQSKAFKLSKMSDAMATTKLVRKFGGHLYGLHDSAITATIEETGLSHGTVQEHWKRYRKFIAFCVAHNVMDDPYSN